MPAKKKQRVLVRKVHRKAAVLVRVLPGVRLILRREAKAQGRSMQYLVENILTLWAAEAYKARSQEGKNNAG